MAINTLQLPIDIPWKRLCVSLDMLDPTICDRRFPFRWRSSLAVFGYEPPEEYQQYEGMLVSYLKVSYTITGYQPDPEEIGIKNRKISSYWNDPVVIDNYLDVVAKYYPCYGALLEVAIAPTKEHVRDVAITDYPYFSDFDPKKRELYELVSETGEMMSRSLENVNVRKGTTTTDSHEVLDIFGGGGLSVNTPYGGGGVSVQGQWGTRDINSQEYTNIRTTDQAREQRELYSHTTQLTQMYHQFDSYHIGTNRAVFFALPRPHIVQAEEATFVNGPRHLEGIQEVFLVVMRPKRLHDFCVEAYLETAHIANTPNYHYEQSTAPLTLHVTKQAEDTSGGLGDDSNVTYAEDSATFTPPDGWEVDLDRDGGYHIDSASGDRIVSYGVTSIARDHVTVTGKVSAWFEDRTWPESNLSHNGELNLVVTVYIRKKQPDIESWSKSLYLTGRGVCCCDDHRRDITDAVKEMGPSVVLERPLSKYVREATGTSAAPAGAHGRAEMAKGGRSATRTASADQAGTAVGIGERMTVATANNIRAGVGRFLRESINDPERYPLGVVRFTESKTVASAIAAVVRASGHPDNHELADIAGLDPAIVKKVGGAGGRVTRGRLLGMSFQEQQERFGLSDEETVALRRALVGLEGPEPDPKHRWTRGAGGGGMVDVRGRTLDDAKRLLHDAGVEVAEPTVVDSPRPAGTVIEQYPRAGQPVRGAARLVVASGAVTVPAVVGRTRDQAVKQLHAAGITRDPVIVEVPDRAPRDQVVAVAPPAGSTTTPNAQVVLHVSTGGGGKDAPPGGAAEGEPREREGRPRRAR